MKHPASCILIILLSFLFVRLSYAQRYKIELVKDINTTGSSLPHDLVVYKNKLVFAAGNPSWGNEPWISDGSREGTVMLKNINLRKNAVGDDSSDPEEFTIAGDQLYFHANDDTHSYEPWITDGTNDGTKLVKDLRPGGLSANPSDFAAYNGRLIFSADGGYGDEPFISDGTPDGTYMIKNINTASSYPTGFFQFDSICYFSARSNSTGDEFWRTNGTEPGTYMVKQLNPIPGQSSHPMNFTTFGQRLFFSANSGTYGWELFSSDGTSAGTSLFVRTDTVTPTGSYPMNLFVYNDRLYFNADDGIHGRELFSVSSDPKDLKMVKDINPDGNADPADFTVYNGLLYFSADDSNGTELWVTDGSEAGTKRVSDINPYGDANPEWLTVFDNKLFFSAGGLLYYTNGTDTGTVQLGNDTIGLDNNYVSNLTVYNNSLFFSAQYDSLGIELYKVLVNPSSTGPKPPENEFALRVYPNPCSDVLYFSISKTPNDGILEIINPQGNIVYTSKISCLTNGAVSIPLSTLQQGLYCLRLTSGNQSSVAKFIKY